jgi:ribonuclease D
LVASKELLATVSTEMAIPQENILSPETLKQLCFEPPAPLTLSTLQDAMRARLVRQWQIDAVAAGLVNALATQAKKEEELNVLP